MYSIMFYIFISKLVYPNPNSTSLKFLNSIHVIEEKQNKTKQKVSLSFQHDNLTTIKNKYQL